jgi:hypothetical protein
MKTAFVLALVASAGAASAQVMSVDLGSYTIDRVTGGLAQPSDGFSDRVVNDSYRNWASPPSALTGVYSHGLGTLNGDDLNMVANGAGWLDDMGFSIANNNAAGQRLANLSGSINFFRQSDLSFIAGFTVSVDAAAIFGSGGLDGGFSARLSFGAGALKPLNIFFGANTAIWALIQWDTATVTGGGSTAAIGQQLRNPPAVGTSANQLVLLNNVTPAPFANVVGNSSFFIRTDNIPTPGSLALLGLAGIAAGRRRR